MHVRPEDEQQQDRDAASSRRRSLRQQQEQKRDEHHVAEALRADRRRRREVREHADRGDDRNRRRPGAERAGGSECEGERTDHADDVDRNDEPEPADPLRLVDKELGEPLLVDPVLAVPEDGQPIPGRQAVLVDEPADDQSQPAIRVHHPADLSGEEVPRAPSTSTSRPSPDTILHGPPRRIRIAATLGGVPAGARG